MRRSPAESRNPVQAKRGASPQVTQPEIILEDDFVSPIPNLNAKIEKATADLPTLPTFDQLQVALLEGSSAEAERFIQRKLRRQVALWAGVGHDALYKAIQSTAQIYQILEQARGRRGDELRGYFGVKAKQAKPVHALVNNLFGLPAKELDGGEARHAALTRHSKYARAVQGAAMRGIPPAELADALRDPGGLTALAEVARRQGPTAERAEPKLGGRRPQRSATAETNDVQHGEGVSTCGELLTSEIEPTGRQELAARAGRSRTPKALGLRSVSILASTDQARCLADGTDIAVCLVNRDGVAPELFAGVRLPERLRFDQEAAFAWVCDAIAAAKSADAKMDSTRPGKLRGGRNGQG